MEIKLSLLVILCGKMDENKKYTNSELKTLLKDDIIKHFLTLQTNYESLIAENAELKNTIISMNERFVKLENDVGKLSESSNDEIRSNKRLYELEKNMYASQQYSRRDSIEIVGIAANVTDDQIEAKCCDILCDIGAPTTPDEIQACHRLFDNKRTIVKFVSRKSVFNIMKKRSQLASIDEYKKKVYINDSLCPYYRFLHGKCKQLWKQKKIFGFWVSNGSVRYRVQENGNFVKVEHLEDLERVFGVIE